MSNPLVEAYASISKNINKMRNKDVPETEEGIVSLKYPELKLDISNQKLVDLTNKWEKEWTSSPVYAQWLKDSEENEKYWRGKHYSRPEMDSTRAQVDNAIFEALETYLPQVTRRNPEPTLALVNKKEEEDPEKQEFVTELKDKLGSIADDVKLRLKLKKEARHWAIYLLGAQKYTWDLDLDIPTVKVIRVQKLILDPNATVDEDGYTGNRIGEHRKLPASDMIAIIEGSDPEEGAVKYIKDLVKEDLDTEVGFVEFWTPKMMWWKLGDKILFKKRNIHWNYDKEVQGESTVDEMGTEIPGEMQKVKGQNHFPSPRMPYKFLSVFNLGKQPVDDTSLIGQNLANQDTINKRNKQIDKNADSQNNGVVVSLERSGLNDAQAKNVSEAFRKGGTVAIPTGAVQDAIMRIPAPALPADIYNDLLDKRNRMKDIFGTRGSSAAGLETETTVRGKVMNRTLDSDRIGGGFSEYLEQMADDAYDWFIQLLYVYDDKYANMADKPKVNSSVKEGSLLPKDSTTIANQAIELAAGGKMSIIDLYKRLDYPNPEELAANVWLEINAPEILFEKDPRVQQAIQMKQQAAQSANVEPTKPPSMSISFKDLPPDGQAQMAKIAGIELDPEGIAAHEEFKKSQEKPLETPVMAP